MSHSMACNQSFPSSWADMSMSINFGILLDNPEIIVSFRSSLNQDYISLLYATLNLSSDSFYSISIFNSSCRMDMGSGNSYAIHRVSLHGSLKFCHEYIPGNRYHCLTAQRIELNRKRIE